MSRGLMSFRGRSGQARGSIATAAFLGASAATLVAFSAPSAPAAPTTPAASPPPQTDTSAATTAVCSISPETVAMQPTQSAPGGAGNMTLLMQRSPYGVSVDAEGHYAYEVTVEVTRLRRRAGANYIVWAATPELDQVAKLGALDEGNRVTGTVRWNKFLVFVSQEASPAGDTWSGPILLTGLSPSGRMHTMAGHGPFEDVDCQYF